MMITITDALCKAAAARERWLATVPNAERDEAWVREWTAVIQVQCLYINAQFELIIHTQSGGMLQ